MAYYSPIHALYTEKTLLNISAVMREFSLKMKCFLSVILYMALVEPKYVGMLMQTTEDNHFRVNRQTHTAIHRLTGIL